MKPDQVVEQNGLWYHVNQNSNRSNVVEHGLPMVCGLYYTGQTIRHHKILYMLHKDLSGLLRILISYQDGWLYRLCSLIL